MVDKPKRSSNLPLGTSPQTGECGRQTARIGEWIWYIGEGLPSFAVDGSNPSLPPIPLEDSRGSVFSFCVGGSERREVRAGIRPVRAP